MEYLNELLPIIIYILLIVLISLLIVIAIKAIKAINKAQSVINDVDKKVSSLNGFFSIIDNATDKLSLFSDRLINIILGVFDKLKSKKKKNSDEITDEKEKENNE